MRSIPWQSSVAELAPTPQYRNVVEKIKSLAPVIPAFSYKGESNIEEIKFKLAQREMHDLVMSILQPKGTANERVNND